MLEDVPEEVLLDEVLADVDAEEAEVAPPSDVEPEGEVLATLVEPPMLLDEDDAFPKDELPVSDRLVEGEASELLLAGDEGNAAEPEGEALDNPVEASELFEPSEDGGA